MTKLIEALTDLALAGTAYLNRINQEVAFDAESLKPGPVTFEKASTEEQISTEKKPRKPRAPKAEVTATVTGRMTGSEPNAQNVPQTVEMTEAESAKLVMEIGHQVCARFSKPSSRAGADGKILIGRDGKPVVEGFYMVKDMLAADFKVVKVADLVHAQRVQFIAKCKALLAQADTQPAPAVGVGL